jgi:hypothetical protein
MITIELLLHLGNSRGPTLNGLKVNDGSLIHGVCEGATSALMPVSLG